MAHSHKRDGSHGRKKKVPPGAGEGSTDDALLKPRPLPDT